MGRKSNAKKKNRKLKEKDFSKTEEKLEELNHDISELEKELNKNDNNSKKKNKKLSKKEKALNKLNKKLNNKESKKEKALNKKQKKKQEKQSNQNKKADQKLEKSAKKTKSIKHKLEYLLVITLLIIFAAILVVLSYLVFQRAFRPQEIAKLLPADDTIAFIEINIDKDHAQIEQTIKLLSQYPEYSIENIEKYIDNQIFSILLNTEKDRLTLEKNIKPWINRQAAFAIFKDENGEIQTAIFLEYKDKKLAEEFIETSELNAKLVNKYIVISDTDYDFNAIDKTLYKTDKYQKIKQNLPIQQIAFIYIDFDNIDNLFFQKFSFLSEQGISMLKIGPLIQSLDSEGISLFALEDEFAIQSFLKIDRELVENTKYLPSREIYQANLTKYISKDALLFWGGQNFENQIKRVFEITSKQHNSNISIVDKVLEQYTNKYFGEDIDFKNDILTLFKNEFIISLEKTEDIASYKIIFELDANQSENEIEKIDKIIHNFASVTGAFDTKIISHTLIDGTVGQEIIAIPKEIIRTEEEYKDQKIITLGTKDAEYGIYYTLIDNILILSNEKVAIKNSIDLSVTSDESIRNQSIFTNNISQALQNSDEVSYLDINQILKILFKDNENIEQYNIINSITNGRTYFNDGVVTLNYIELK